MNLAGFLVVAKLHTYAGGGSTVPLADGSKEATYEQDKWVYRDRYFGFDPFAGEEIVWLAGHPVWSMAYYGRTLNDQCTAEAPSATDIYSFLQRAMREITPDRPFRGPTRFQEGDLEYSDASQGDLEAFTGTETILCRHHEVYRLVYHGGALGKRG